LIGLDGSAEEAREQRIAESILKKIGIVAEAQANQ
jgi:hypothetical protein